jgi:hypothetical protein
LYASEKNKLSLILPKTTLTMNKRKCQS